MIKIEHQARLVPLSGPVAKWCQEIQKESGATVVNIEERDGAGFGEHFCDQQRKHGQGHVPLVKGIVAVPDIGRRRTSGKVKTIHAVWCNLLSFYPAKMALLHISEIKWERVETMDGVLEVGEESNG